MKYYAGLDVSMTTTSICVEDETGAKVLEKIVDTQPEAISSALARFGEDLERIGLETGNLSPWLTKELRKMGYPVKCIDARLMAAILSTVRNKNDRNDAQGIARAIRCENYREVHTKSDWSQRVKVLLGSRSALVRMRVETTNMIRGHLKSSGIRVALGSRNKFIEKINSILPILEIEAQVAIAVLLRVFEQIKGEIDLLTKVIQKTAEENEQAKNLMTIPGVGPIIALSFVAEIDDPARFKDSRSVGAYAGLTPSQYQSGETDRSGRISKRGPSHLRTLLVEAALVMMTRSSKWSRLKNWGVRLAAKKGIKKAAVALGRKLAVVMHRMLLTGEPFIAGEKKEAKAV